MRRVLLVTLVLLTVGSCGREAPAAPTSPETSEGVSCRGATLTSCDELFEHRGRQDVRIQMRCREFARSVATDDMCERRAIPVFMHDSHGLVSRGCAGRDDDMVEVCGSFDREFRDRISHLPIFTVLEVDWFHESAE